MLTIQTDVNSLNIQNNLGVNNANMQTAVQRLSSGFRINSAADDSAGYAIAANLSLANSGLQAGSNNAMQASAMLNIANSGVNQIKDMLAEHKGYLILSQLPKNLPSGQDMQQYFDQIGLVRKESPVRMFGELDEALEWVEDRILAAEFCEVGEGKPLELGDYELFQGRKPDTMAALEQIIEKRSCKAGEKIFSLGDHGDEIYFIRSGEVRIVLPISETQRHHLGTFGRGAFFGEMAFLDGKARSADAQAFTDTELYVLSRKDFNLMVEQHKKLGLVFMEGLASVLATRLRYTNGELRALEA